MRQRPWGRHPAARPVRPRRWPAGLAWALWALTILGLPCIAWLDHLLRQAGGPELPVRQAGIVPEVVAAVSAATVGALSGLPEVLHVTLGQPG